MIQVSLTDTEWWALCHAVAEYGATQEEDHEREYYEGIYKKIGEANFGAGVVITGR